jgi:hypothetical protein
MLMSYIDWRRPFDLGLSQMPPLPSKNETHSSPPCIQPHRSCITGVTLIEDAPRAAAGLQRMM